MTRKKIFSEKKEAREVVYGVTDRSNDSWIVSLNEWLIDSGRVRDKEKELMYSSLELLVRSGVKFTKAIRLLAKRAKNERLKRILRTIAYDMENRGMSFSASMTKYPDVFEASESKMIYSGEVTGQLEQTLGAIAQQVQKNLQLRMQVKSALTYPMVVFAAILGAIIVVINVIVPSLAGMFTEFGSELPKSTQILLWMSESFKQYWWLCLGGFAIGGSVFQAWKKTYEGKRLWDGIWLKAPLIRSIANNIQTVRVSGNLSTLLDSGVSVPKALHILGEMMPNSVVGDALFNVEQRVVHGDQLHTCFQEEPVFDEVLGEVMEVGEKGGKVAEILRKTGRQYQLELDSQLKNLMTIMEPLVIVFVGGAVILMALAILTPILQLTTLFAEGT